MHPKYTQTSLFEKPVRVSRIECICTVCASRFYVKPSSVRAGRGKTCSRECQYKSVSIKARERDRPQTAERVTITCPVCSNNFTMRRSDYEGYVSRGAPPTYCSKRCAHDSPNWKRNLSASLRNSDRFKASRPAAIAAMTAKARSPEGRQQRREQALEQMSDPQKRTRWEAAIRKRTNDPAWRAAEHFQRGAAHPRYTGYKTARQIDRGRYESKAWRVAVFRRDNYTCQVCGVRGGRLNAHHIKPWATVPALRHDVANGITLCEPCHRGVHNGSVTLETHDHTPGT